MSDTQSAAAERPPLVLNGAYLPVHDLEAVARHGRRVVVSAAAMASVARARQLVEELLASGKTAYGINTGFGELSHVRIERADVAQLQVNLVRSHSVGVGAPLPLDVVRGMMLLRADSLSRGHSGVRPEVVERLVALLNARITPVVPEQGSVGASGDLAPLAHLASTLIGEGEVVDAEGIRRPAAEALAAAGLPPLTLEAKEGLALINGTQAMTATGALAWCDADRLHQAATAAAALSLEAMMGSFKPFDARFHAVRPHPGAGEVARDIRALTALSTINESHVNCARVQDPYSLRCIAPVLGASRDALTHAREVLEREMRSVTDNPLCFPDSGEILSGGNFHGQPVALVMDYMAIALAEVASFSERRTYLLLDGQGGLPEFLAARPRPAVGVDDGAVHRRGARLREQGAGASGQRRLHPHLGGDGGSCLDGDDGRQQAAPRRGKHAARRGRGTALRRRGAGVSPAAHERRRRGGNAPPGPRARGAPDR